MVVQLQQTPWLVVQLQNISLALGIQLQHIRLALVIQLQ